MGNVGTFITLLCNVLQAFVSPPCSFAPLPHLTIFLQLTGFFRLKDRGTSALFHYLILDLLHQPIEQAVFGAGACDNANSSWLVAHS